MSNYNTSSNNCKTIRELGYKACIPYYIMFDPDLNQNHLKLYTLIEQMESNPNPNVIPTFSYAWFASVIGVERREAMRIAKKLKDKNYIFHKQNKDEKWIWGIVRKEVICDEGGVASNDTPPVASNDTLNTSRIKYNKTKPPIVPQAKRAKALSVEKSNSLSLDDIEKNNPHDIPINLLEEWKSNRKKPITERVLNSFNRELEAIKNAGITPLDAVNKMLDKQWVTVELRYFEQDIAHKKINSFKTKYKTMDEITRGIDLSGGFL